VLELQRVLAQGKRSRCVRCGRPMDERDEGNRRGGVCPEGCSWWLQIGGGDGDTDHDSAAD